jgi:hypothetical protein
MRRHLGPWLLAAAGLVLAVIAAVWGAGLAEAPPAPPGALASTSISITVGDDGAGWITAETVAASGTALGVALTVAALAWAAHRLRTTRMTTPTG